MKTAKLREPFTDLKLICLLTAFYTVFEIIHIIKILYFLNQQDLPWPKHFTGILIIDWLLVISFMSMIAISTKQMILKNVPWSRIFVLHFVLAILISFLIRLAADSYYFWREGLSFQEFEMKDFMAGIMTNLDINFVIYFAMLLIIYSYYYQKVIRQSEIQKETLESQLLTTKIQMLTSQLQPHFLFNTLNGISSLIAIDKKQAQNMVGDLGDFLREILYHSDSSLISVRKEMLLLDKYLNLLKTRFWEQLSVEKNIDDSILDQQMPAMILQPIVENATKHGFSPKNSTLKIIISGYQRNDFICFEIENDGKMVENEINNQKNSEGVGLSNLEERLRNIYGSRYSFSLENKADGSGVVCKLMFPREAV